MSAKPLSFAAAATRSAAATKKASSPKKQTSPKTSPKSSPAPAPVASSSETPAEPTVTPDAAAPTTPPVEKVEETQAEENKEIEEKKETDDQKDKDFVDSGAEGEHPLETMWTFHFDKKIEKVEGQKPNASADLKSYENNLKKIGSFTTVEGFWRHYAWLRKPDDLPKNHNLFCFRKNLVPAWETFPKGGAWILKVRKKNGVIGRLWEELLFAVIGELFEEPDIAGVVLSLRGSVDLLSVWNGDNTNPEVRFKIGDKLREILNLDESTQVEYKSFKSAITDGSSFRNAMPYVYAATAAPANPS